MVNLYTTKQLEDITGVPAATLRSWKQRGKLAEGIHWAKDEQDNLVWTDAGLVAVQALAGHAGDAASLKIAEPATESNAPATEPGDGPIVQLLMPSPGQCWSSNFLEPFRGVCNAS